MIANTFVGSLGYDSTARQTGRMRRDRENMLFKFNAHAWIFVLRK